MMPGKKGCCVVVVIAAAPSAERGRRYRSRPAPTGPPLAAGGAFVLGSPPGRHERETIPIAVVPDSSTHKDMSKLNKGDKDMPATAGISLSPLLNKAGSEPGLIYHLVTSVRAALEQLRRCEPLKIGRSRPRALVGNRRKSAARREAPRGAKRTLKEVGEEEMKCSVLTQSGTARSEVDWVVESGSKNARRSDRKGRGCSPPRMTAVRAPNLTRQAPVLSGNDSALSCLQCEAALTPATRIQGVPGEVCANFPAWHAVSRLEEGRRTSQERLGVWCTARLRTVYAAFYTVQVRRGKSLSAKPAR
ncbi:hypothetical protein HPB48_009043 [Haemaphysalis longicornis]|uniref:Uncharacterized protein n=1 Tax=Haemaphysalis longicornis TaxID=44386 RepID=A0A9J6H2Z1_HAELO|nr:hypothetical protein HPB48_009043 [Haemaphysalis longicornis]